MIGAITNERLASVWASSHHLCGKLLTELSNLGNKQQLNDNMHQEENLGRTTLDAKDWCKIKVTLG